MKLHDFLTAKNETRELAPFLPVEFVVVGEDASGGAKVRNTAQAVLVFVDEDARQNCLIEAQMAAEKRISNLPEGTPRPAIPAIVVDNEFIYHILVRALRDATNHRQPFANSVDQLRVALVKPVAKRLFGQYEEFVDHEFPDKLTVEQAQELEIEAEKK